ncbi:uncharacterized protein LOC128986077 isoform X2 [Macrosteles quadrilineatus]|uniref:uncharacterized protein LOC128986077 isoform X2 n=1 Tax=Macrosteles quadrilineatus TaxID=74068 RepID=UPI0023E1DDB7|nr:uncharacterized protein LOC128986077 isoform X2 [Macrosteles quadrilineatus]
MTGINRVIQYFRWRPILTGLCSTHKWRNFRKRSSAAVLLAHCASIKDDKIVPVQFPDLSHLSHEQLIKQACTATVNSASQLLTCTLVAVIDVSNKYSKALKDQLSLLEESLTHLGNEGVQENLTDLITEARNNVDSFRRAFRELDSLMEYVEKLVISATETSYLAGAETACEALSERLHSAKTKVWVLF